MTVDKVVERADAYKIKSIYVEDGNNVLDVYDAMSEAIEYAREGNGPVLVEAKSYRWFGHSASDAGKYRDKAEVDAWKEKDPNVAFKKYLVENKIATESVIKNTQTSALVEVSVNIFAPIFPPLIVFPASSRPIRDTTVPIAAGGSTIFIQSVLNL